MDCEGNTISKSRPYNDCVVLETDAFDPDAVFMDTIVDDDVLPKLSLAVDGLTTNLDGGSGGPDVPRKDAENDEVIQPSTHMPVASLDPEHLEVYGWESTLWRKIRGYLGF